MVMIHASMTSTKRFSALFPWMILTMEISIPILRTVSWCQSECPMSMHQLNWKPTFLFDNYFEVLDPRHTSGFFCQGDERFAPYTACRLQLNFKIVRASILLWQCFTSILSQFCCFFHTFDSIKFCPILLLVCIICLFVSL